MSLKLWLMFLVPTIGALLTCLLSVTGNNIVLVAMCALVAGLTGIVPQLPDDFSFLGRRLGSANTGATLIRDLGMGIATGCFSFIITFFMPLMLFSRAVGDAMYDVGIQADNSQFESVVSAIWLTTLIGAVPLNALIGATIIANAQRSWLAALMTGIGFMVTSVFVGIVGASETSARIADNPLGFLGVTVACALAIALIVFLGALARSAFVRQSKVGQETPSS